MPGASILLLEDDTELRDLLTEALTDDGYVVRACASVDDLRQVGSDGRPTLAIVDAWGQSYATLSDVERREIQDVARGVPTIMVTARGWAQTMQPADLAANLACLQDCAGVDVVFRRDAERLKKLAPQLADSSPCGCAVHSRK